MLSFRITIPILALGLVSSFFSGCDSFGPEDVLLDLEQPATDVRALQTDGGWAVRAALLDGEAYKYPKEESDYSVVFSPSESEDEPGALSFTTGGGCSGVYTAETNGHFDVEFVPLCAVPYGSKHDPRELSIAFLGALRRAERFEIRDNILQLYTPDGEGLRLERAKTFSFPPD